MTYLFCPDPAALTAALAIIHPLLAADQRPYHTWQTLPMVDGARYLPVPEVAAGLFPDALPALPRAAAPAVTPPEQALAHAVAAFAAANPAFANTLRSLLPVAAIVFALALLTGCCPTRPPVTVRGPLLPVTVRLRADTLHLATTFAALAAAQRQADSAGQAITVATAASAGNGSGKMGVQARVTVHPGGRVTATCTVDSAAIRAAVQCPDLTCPPCPMPGRWQTLADAWGYWGWLASLGALGLFVGGYVSCVQAARWASRNG